MDAVLLAARLLLAAVFATAGVAKLADLAGSRQAVAGFGVPTRLAVPLGTALPVVELVLALLLLPAVTAPWAALGGLLLLLAFVGGISVNLARGRAPDCHCFGQLHSSPVSWRTLARNGLLALLSGFVVVAGWSNPGPSGVGWMSDLSGPEIVVFVGGLLLLILLSIEAWLLLHLMQQNGRLLARLDVLEVAFASDDTHVVPTPATQPAAGLPVGSPAPAFSLAGLHGETLTLEALRARGKPVMLVFSDPNCGPCNTLMPEIGAWQREYAADLTIVVISSGTADANGAKATEHSLGQVLLQREREVAESYQSRGTPSAVVVRPDGIIGSPLAQGAPEIRGLVTRTLGRLPSAGPSLLLAPSLNGGRNGHRNGHGAVATGIGASAPDVSLQNLDGETVQLADFRGRDTMLLFWNPGCGFCQRMLADLNAWEARASSDAPRLLIVSTGTIEANRAHGLTSTIVLDQGFVIGRAFGASGTPSAILVDRDGRIASNVAVGASAVLALASGKLPERAKP